MGTSLWPDFPRHGLTIVIHQAQNLPVQDFWDPIDELFPPKIRVHAVIKIQGLDDIDLKTSQVAVFEDEECASQSCLSLLLSLFFSLADDVLRLGQ